jgi:hypothetical protein
MAIPLGDNHQLLLRIRSVILTPSRLWCRHLHIAVVHRLAVYIRRSSFPCYHSSACQINASWSRGYTCNPNLNMSKLQSLTPILTIRESPHVARMSRLLIDDPIGISAVYHAGHDYNISMQPLDAEFDASGFAMHVPATKLTYAGFAPQYLNYLSNS